MAMRETKKRRRRDKHGSMQGQEVVEDVRVQEWTERSGNCKLMVPHQLGQEMSNTPKVDRNKRWRDPEVWKGPFYPPA